MAGKIFSSVNTESDRERFEAYSSYRSGKYTFNVILPWSFSYKLWWGFTVFAAAFTIFLETYQIAFSPGGLSTTGGAALEFILLAVFGIDIIINFNLAYYDADNKIVFSRRAIARNYLRCMFWIDFIGIFPFYVVALQISGELGNQNKTTQLLGLLRLFKLVRMH